MGLKLQGSSHTGPVTRPKCWHSLLFLSGLQKWGRCVFFIFKRHPNGVSFRPTTSGYEPDSRQFVLAFLFVFCWSMNSHSEMTHPTNRSPPSPPPQAPYDCLVQVRTEHSVPSQDWLLEPLFLPPHAVPSHTHTKGISRKFWPTPKTQKTYCFMGLS